MFSPAFVADCLETLIEIGSEYQEIFEEHGGEHVQLVASCNTEPADGLTGFSSTGAITAAESQAMPAQFSIFAPASCTTVSYKRCQQLLSGLVVTIDLTNTCASDLKLFDTSDRSPIRMESKPYQTL